MTIKIQTKDGIQEVWAHRIKLPRYRRLELAIHRAYDRIGILVITEINTGMMVSAGETVTEAVQNAHFKIKRYATC